MNKAWAFRFAIPMAMVGVCVVGAQQKPNELGFFITSVGSGKGRTSAASKARTSTASSSRRRQARAIGPGAPT